MIVASLLTRSLEFFQKHLSVILTGAVIFGVLQFLVMAAFVGTSLGTMQKISETMEEQGGVMNEFMAKLEAGDEAAIEAMLNDEEKQKEVEAAASAMAMKGMKNWKVFGGFFTGLGASMLIMMIIGLFSSAFFSLVAVKAPASVGSAFGMAVNWFFPLVGLWIWMFLRSFAWIPFIGIVIAIVLGPRFILSPLYLLEQNKGVMDSVSSSMAHTKGKWGQIVLNGLLGFLLIIIVTAVATKIVGFVPVLPGIVHYAGSAFLTIYGIQLARAVMAGQLR